jgi:chain length determinant protein (polysaccharide antigen chain regulator)
MDSNNSPQVNDYDEIDLFELVENLWDQKVLIALFALVSVSLGYCYTLVAPEKWTAEMHISEASPLQIDPLNPPELSVFKQQVSLEDQLKDKTQSDSKMLSVKALNEVAPEITPADLMKFLTSEIRSVRTLLQFDAQRSESIFKNSAELTEEERIEAANGFLENMLKITPPSKTTTNTAIALTLDSPASASSVLSDYVQFADEKIVKKREENLKLAITRAIQTNEFEIERSKRSYVRRLEEDLALLEEALRIAQSAGIKDNQSGLFVDRNDNRLTEASGLYLRGERLLRAEMRALKARISSSALIPEVRNLQAENELLKGIVIDTKTASSFLLEKPATPPTGRDSPKTKLVLALALVLGGMLGVLTALIRTAIRNRKTKALG